MIDNEDDISESDSDDGDETSDEIQEITALEHFASMLQKAHDLAVTAERAREKGRKRPKIYVGNSVRTKEWCLQRGWELAAKGFHSVKAWLLSNSHEMTACSTPEPGPIYLDLHEESEESVSEDEI